MIALKIYVNTQTITTWVKLCSTEFFCNTKVARLGKFFVKWKFSGTCVLCYVPACSIYRFVTSWRQCASTSWNITRVTSPPAGWSHVTTLNTSWRQRSSCAYSAHSLITSTCASRSTTPPTGSSTRCKGQSSRGSSRNRRSLGLGWEWKCWLFRLLPISSYMYMYMYIIYMYPCVHMHVLLKNCEW